MASAFRAADSSPTTQEEQSNSIEPFYILHRATPPKKKRKHDRVARKIDLSDPSQSPSQLQISDTENSIDFHRIELEQKRIDAFQFLWANFENLIKSVMHNIHSPIFDSIHQWIIESSTSSAGDLRSNRILTAFVVSRNVEFVDDLQVFEDLEMYFRSNGFHVASLSSIEFSTANDVSDSVKSLLRQFIQIHLDGAADILVLASWYEELGDNSKPLIVIVRDMERCCGSVLSDFILMLSEMAEELPVVLVMGVSTSTDAAKSLFLPTGILRKLHPFKFWLPSPHEKMEETVKQVLVKSPFGSCIGHDVALFLRNNFFIHDGSFSAFVRGLKVACVLNLSEHPFTTLEDGTSERHKNRSATLLCIHEVAKRSDIPLLDLFCDAVGGCVGGLTFRTARGVKDLPAAHTADLISAWMKHTDGIPCMRDKIEQLNTSLLHPGVVVGKEAACSLEEMVVKYVKHIPCDEVGKMEKLRSAVVGDVRKTVQIDLLSLFSTDSVHDTSVLYSLAQEHGDFINVHDWYSSFCGRCVVGTQDSQKKKKIRVGGAGDVARIQARFCRAAVELQLTGLIRSTKNPHHVQRVGFGI